MKSNRIICDSAMADRCLNVWFLTGSPDKTRKVHTPKNIYLDNPRKISKLPENHSDKRTENLNRDTQNTSLALGSNAGYIDGDNILDAQKAPIQDAIKPVVSASETPPASQSSSTSVDIKGLQPPIAQPTTTQAPQQSTPPDVAAKQRVFSEKRVFGNFNNLSPDTAIDVEISKGPNSYNLKSDFDSLQGNLSSAGIGVGQMLECRKTW